jgi:hypothetical protein
VNSFHAYRVAKALIHFGHGDSPVIPHADMTMAAHLADVPQPATAEDRAQVCNLIDEIEAGR